ncbi:hypothetical protein TNIN_177421 [Trichonephila inaurata madagascariensis]|uniref:Uncharacterized protein n=1 Tax=Trichonephila inaurata madagascariensis TaxID=2747483 RepID=A0A8X7CQY7_9ARAC|nr:hypothetical protein TNIN_177421 [Trichonephila inaurata madagascariensis]
MMGISTASCIEMSRIEGSGPVHQSVHKLQGSLHLNIGRGHLRGCTLKKCVATGSPSTTAGFEKLCWQRMFSVNE